MNLNVVPENARILVNRLDALKRVVPSLESKLVIQARQLADLKKTADELKLKVASTAGEVKEAGLKKELNEVVQKTAECKTVLERSMALHDATKVQTDAARTSVRAAQQAVASVLGCRDEVKQVALGLNEGTAAAQAGVATVALEVQQMRDKGEVEHAALKDKLAAATAAQAKLEAEVAKLSLAAEDGKEDMNNLQDTLKGLEAKEKKKSQVVVDAIKATMGDIKSNTAAYNKATQALDSTTGAVGVLHNSLVALEGRVLESEQSVLDAAAKAIKAAETSVEAAVQSGAHADTALAAAKKAVSAAAEAKESAAEAKESAAESAASAAEAKKHVTKGKRAGLSAKLSELEEKQKGLERAVVSTLRGLAVAVEQVQVAQLAANSAAHGKTQNLIDIQITKMKQRAIDFPAEEAEITKAIEALKSEKLELQSPNSSKPSKPPGYQTPTPRGKAGADLRAAAEPDTPVVPASPEETVRDDE